MAVIAALALTVASGFCLPDNSTAVPVLYRVTGSGRLPFYRTADCKEASCRQGTYVVPGDEVIVYDRVDGRSCAFFQRVKETVGWVDSDRLVVDAVASHPPLAAWRGDWHYGDDHIRLMPASAKRLTVTGDAYWPAAHVAKDAPANWPHFGELDGAASVDGNRATYNDGNGEFACKVSLRLLGTYLVVDDNENCGGNNVRFRGVYRRGR